MKIVGVSGFRGLWALKWAWQTFFLGQSIGIDENNTFQLNSSFYSSIKTVGATVLCGLWALEWAWNQHAKSQ